MPDGARVDLGGVKIGRRGMLETQGSSELPAMFEALDDSFFSIGQSENYYETLIPLGDQLREEFLHAIRDCARNTAILAENAAEPVMRESLLRDIKTRTVHERLHRLATGQAALTRYSFSYESPGNAGALAQPPLLDFEVRPASLPATNIPMVALDHRLIQLAQALLNVAHPALPGSAKKTPTLK